MNLTFSDEQKMIQKMVRDFSLNRVTNAVERMEKEDRFPQEIVKEMAQLGLMGIPISEKYGGAGLDFTSYIIAIHEISKVSPALGVILSVHTSVGTNPILHFGHEKQKQKFVPLLAKGEWLGAFALTEPGAGSDAANVKTTATIRGDHYVLNGTKIFITNGGVADTYVTFALTSPEKGTKGMTAFIVEKHTPGVTFGKKERKMGLHGSNTTEVLFEDAKVPVENRLGQEGEGYKIALANLSTGRVGIAAQSLGIAEGAFQAAKRYAKERKQFGKPIGSMQGVSFKLADMATKIEAAKLLTYRAANLITEEKPCAKESSMAKLFASRVAMDVAIDAVQIFGGYGYSKESPVERYFRDAKVCEIYEGTSEIQRIVMSKHLLGLAD